MPGITKEVPATGRLQRIDLGTDWSSGDLSSGGQLALNVPGRKIDIRDGTAAAPIVTVAPTVKVSRQETITRAAIAAITGSPTSDGAAGLAAINGSSSGSSSTEAQTVGVFGGATNASNASGPSVQPDACGVYGHGRITGGNAPTASCYGGVFGGRRDVDTAVAVGAEIECLNYTLTDEAYSPNGSYPSGKTRGLWIVPGGTADSSCAIAVNNPFGPQFDVGLGFGSLVAGGNTGAVKSASIRDDSHSSVALDIRGQHTTAAVTIDAGAGAVIVGARTPSGFVTGSGTLLDVVAAQSATPAVFRGSGAYNIGVSVTNSQGDMRLFVAGNTNGFLTGTAAGDTGVIINASKNFHIGRSGGAANLIVGNGLGFFGTAPQAKPTGVAVTASGIHAALVTLGLIAA